MEVQKGQPTKRKVVFLQGSVHFHVCWEGIWLHIPGHSWLQRSGFSCVAQRGSMRAPILMWCTTPFNQRSCGISNIKGRSVLSKDSAVPSRKLQMRCPATPPPPGKARAFKQCRNRSSMALLGANNPRDAHSVSRKRSQLTMTGCTKIRQTAVPFMKCST